MQSSWPQEASGAEVRSSVGMHSARPHCWPAVLGGAVGALIPSLILVYAGLQDVLLGTPYCNLLDLGGAWSKIPSASPQPSSQAYTIFYQSSHQACTRESKNKVLARRDSHYYNFLPPVRPWSFNPLTYSPDPSLPFCDTPHSLLLSLKLGQRQPVGQSESDTRFTPHGCNYRWHTSDGICEICSRYSSISIIGDSFSRHMTGGLLMLLTNDAIYGALPRLSPSPKLYENCACDGQFSEHQFCRTGKAFEMENPHAYGVCSSHPEFRFQYVGHGLLNFSTLCSPDPRPRLVLLQGGAHQGAVASTTISEIVTPGMELLNQTIGSCEHRIIVKVVWSGLCSQKAFMDVRYPWQSDANASIFNENVSQFVRATYGMETLDFMNLTKDAAVSDGYHYLSEVNAIKAMYLVNLLDLWSK